MRKCASCTIGGKEYFLYFNVAATMEIEDKFKGKGISEIIFSDKKINLENESVVAEILIQQGELLRRYYGYDSREVITSKDIILHCKPLEYLQYHEAIIRAVILGYGKEEPGEKIVDVGLQELEKDKKVNISRIINNALHLGITKRDLMIDYTVGELSDLIDIRNKETNNVKSDID